MNDLLTRRLVLRPPVATDLADSFALWSNPDVVRFIGGKPSTQEEAWRRLLRYAGLWALMGFGYWIVRDRENGSFVGEVGFARFQRGLGEKFDNALEAGWAIAPDRQGYGMAFEALSAAMSWAGEHRPSQDFVCLISPENSRSITLAERVGFRAYDEVQYKGAATRLFSRANNSQKNAYTNGVLPIPRPRTIQP